MTEQRGHGGGIANHFRRPRRAVRRRQGQVGINLRLFLKDIIRGTVGNRRAFDASQRAVDGHKGEPTCRAPRRADGGIEEHHVDVRDVRSIPT